MQCASTHTPQTQHHPAAFYHALEVPQRIGLNRGSTLTEELETHGNPDAYPIDSLMLARSLMFICGFVE